MTFLTSIPTVSPNNCLSLRNIRGIVLSRQHPHAFNLQFFLTALHPHMSCQPRNGAWLFPGHYVSPPDADIPIRRSCRGIRRLYPLRLLQNFGSTFHLRFDSPTESPTYHKEVLRLREAPSLYWVHASRFWARTISSHKRKLDDRVWALGMDTGSAAVERWLGLRWRNPKDSCLGVLVVVDILCWDQ